MVLLGRSRRSRHVGWCARSPAPARVVARRLTRRNPVTAPRHAASMATVHFLPSFAQVLDDVVTRAHRQGRVDVECRPDVDPVVIAAQLRRYAADSGRPLRCTARADRVEVRADGSGTLRAG